METFGHKGTLLGMQVSSWGARYLFVGPRNPFSAFKILKQGFIEILQYLVGKAMSSISRLQVLKEPLGRSPDHIIVKFSVIGRASVVE